MQKELEPAASIQNLDDIARATVKSTSQVLETVRRTSLLSSTPFLHAKIMKPPLATVPKKQRARTQAEDLSLRT